MMPSYMNILPVNGKIPTIPWSEFTERKQTQEEKNKILKNKEIGVITGKVSNILVLDDDGGDLSQYPIPKTWIQRTPRGGKHYIFRWTDELDNKITTKTGILPKVDVRGEKGYIKYYGFDKRGTFTLAKPPKWLIDLLPDKVRPVVKQFSETKEGNRDESFYKMACSLRARGSTEDEIFELLCPKANEVGFTHKELREKCRSACKHEPKQKIVNSGSLDITSFLEDEEKVEWIVPGIIAKNSIGFIAGLPETKKTFILIDLSVEASRRGNLCKTWLNKFEIKSPLKVLFIDQERFKGETQRRFKAVIQGKGLSPKELQDNLYIKCGTTTRLDLQHSFEAFRKELSEIRPDLVIVDSFATFHTHDENNRQSIQEVLERVKELRNEFGCTFLFIHHENKNAFNRGDDAEEPSIAQMAGNVAIPAAAETVLTVRKSAGGDSMVYHTKSTLSSTQKPFLVKVIDIDEAKTKIKVEGY